MEQMIKEIGSIKIQSPVCDKQVVTELTSDFSLPDYQPEVKRLLRVQATVSPPAKYIGAGSAEFSGTVDYAILYTGNDGALYCTTESSDYQFSTPLEMTSEFNLNDGLVCDVEVVPDMTVGRVAAPRKLSVKCRLRSRVRILGNKEPVAQISGDLSGSTPTSLQRLCGHAEVARVFTGQGDTLSLGDEILLDADAADLRVIAAEGHVFVNEASCGSGVVNCRGELCLKLLCCHESTPETPIVHLRRIPFSQAVPTDGAEVNCDACASGICSELRITMDDGRILCEAGIRLSTHAQRNETLSFTRDLYSTDRACETAKKSLVLPHAIKCLNGNFSLNTTLPLEETGIRPGMSVLDLSLTPLVTSLESEHGKYYLNGKCRAHIILSDGEEISAQELELPFRYEADGGSENAVDYNACVDVISCRARIDGERLGVDAELAVSMAMRGEENAEILSEAAFGEPFSTASSLWTICYPSREDTLWSVAKRYHRSVDGISERNELAAAPAADTPESLMGVRYLLV